MKISQYTTTQAKAAFTALMKRARKRSLSPGERGALVEVTQRLRQLKKGRANPAVVGYKTKKGALWGVSVGRGKKGSRSLSLALGRQNRPRRRAAPRRNTPASLRAAGGVRIGQIVQLRYVRDVGRKQGLYRHDFKSSSRASVWTMPDGSVVIR